MILTITDIILLIYTIYNVSKQNFSKKKQIIIIASIMILPVIPIIIGFLLDLFVASHSVGWFPILTIYGMVASIIFQLIICISILIYIHRLKSKL